MRIEGLVWHDLRATYGTRLGEAGFNAYDIAKLMGHANISTSQRYVRSLPFGAGEAVILKKSALSQHHRSHALSGVYIGHLFTKGCNLGSGGDIHGSSPTQFVAGLPQTRTLNASTVEMVFSCSFR